MSDLSEGADRDAARTFKALEQVCALRVWLATLLTQTLQAEATIKGRIAGLEQETQGVRAQLVQTTSAIDSLRKTILSVDETIRRQRDAFRAAVSTQSGQTERERENRIEESDQTRRSSRRKDR